jgi:hypothetical protein
MRQPMPVPFPMSKTHEGLSRARRQSGTQSFVLSVLSLLFISFSFMGNMAFGSEPSQPDFPDRLKLWGGYQRLFGLDAKFRFDSPRTGLGSTFDFADDFGGDESDSMIRAGALFRLTPNHAIGISWYAISLRGDKTHLNTDLHIADLIFSAKGEVTGAIDLTLYRAFYAWSFYRSDRVELALSPGIYFGDFGANFEGSLTIEPGVLPPVVEGGTVKESHFVPLPSIGLSVAYKILPRLTANIRTDFFYININQVKGSMAEFFVGLEYRLFKHLAIGSAFNRFWLDIDWKPGNKKGWEINSSWNGVLFYGALYF